MLQFCVFAVRHSRQSRNFLGLTPASLRQSPNSHGINLFAGHHPLTPVLSIFYENIRGGGASITTAPVLHSPSLNPLDATLAGTLVGVADKGLTGNAKPFRCNTYRKQGGGIRGSSC